MKENIEIPPINKKNKRALDAMEELSNTKSVGENEKEEVREMITDRLMEKTASKESEPVKKEDSNEAIEGIDFGKIRENVKYYTDGELVFRRTSKDKMQLLCAWNDQNKKFTVFLSDPNISENKAGYYIDSIEKLKKVCELIMPLLNYTYKTMDGCYYKTNEKFEQIESKLKKIASAE